MADIKLMPKIDPVEINAANSMYANIRNRKWKNAYRAVDELLMVRARKIDPNAQYVHTPALVTPIKR